MKPELDEVSGQNTTGHEWNGIKELNTPMPRPFHIWLWISLAVTAILWILYPSFPYFSGYAKGALGYSSRTAVTEQVEAGQALRAEAFAPFETGDVAELASDASLRAQHEDTIAVLYRDNCSACHGRDARGQTGFPNLVDDQWLWLGSPEEIEYTLQVGINSTHDDTRWAQMPAFGKDGLLEKNAIADVIEYVLAISAQDHKAEAAERGAVVFEENCASCHNEAGKGAMENGAPNLTDAAWVYGGTRETLQETLKYGRAGVMPHWSDRLTDAEIRKLTVYLLWLGEDAKSG